MKVRFLYENQNSYEIELDEPVTLNILQIKSMISSQINIDSTSQRWIYKGKILSDNETLETYSFSNGDTIHILKNNINKSSVGVDSSSSSLSSLSTTQASSTSTTSTTKLISVPQFDDAMKYYLNFNSNEEDVKNCLSTLSKIISNIIDHPYEEKYRHIKNTNQHFHKKVGSHKGSYGLLQSLGFILNDDEWILTPTSETWNTIVSCQQKLNKFLEKLKNNSPNSLQSTNPSKEASSPVSSPLKQQQAAPTSNQLPSPSTTLDPQTLLALQSLASMLSLQAADSGPSITSSSTTTATTQEQGSDNPSNDGNSSSHNG